MTLTVTLLLTLILILIFFLILSLILTLLLILILNLFLKLILTQTQILTLFLTLSFRPNCVGNKPIVFQTVQEHYLAGLPGKCYHGANSCFDLPECHMKTICTIRTGLRLDKEPGGACVRSKLSVNHVLLGLLWFNTNLFKNTVIGSKHGLNQIYY